MFPVSGSLHHVTPLSGSRQPVHRADGPQTLRHGRLRPAETDHLGFAASVNGLFDEMFALVLAPFPRQTRQVFDFGRTRRVGHLPSAALRR